MDSLQDAMKSSNCLTRAGVVSTTPTVIFEVFKDGSHVETYGDHLSSLDIDHLDYASYRTFDLKFSEVPEYLNTNDVMVRVTHAPEGRPIKSTVYYYKNGEWCEAIKPHTIVHETA